MLSLFIGLVILLFVVLLILYFRDRRAVNRRTVESIGDDLWKEIEQEREGSMEAGKKFRRALSKARSKIR